MRPRISTSVVNWCHHCKSLPQSAGVIRRYHRRISGLTLRPRRRQSSTRPARRNPAQIYRHRADHAAALIILSLAGQLRQRDARHFPDEVFAVNKEGKQSEFLGIATIHPKRCKSGFVILIGERLDHRQVFQRRYRAVVVAHDGFTLTNARYRVINDVIPVAAPISLPAVTSACSLALMPLTTSFTFAGVSGCPLW